MLKRLTTAPTNLAKRGEVTKESARFDRITKDVGDLRLYLSADGKTQYLRVWETPDPAKDGTAVWFEIIEPAENPAERK